MNLPETCCLALQGPQALLDLGGYHFGDDIIFDNHTSGIDIDSGFRQISHLLQILIHEVLVAKCHFRLREILLLGFGQGGMAALSTAVAVDQAHGAKDPALVELGGVVSIGAGLAAETPAELDPKCRTPVLVCAGTEGSSVVTRGSEDKLRRVFQHVDVKRYRRSGDGMPGNREEMLPIMQFFSRRLRSVKGVPEGAVELS
jgi:predicted esterase